MTRWFARGRDLSVQSRCAARWRQRILVAPDSSRCIGLRRAQGAARAAKPGEARCRSSSGFQVRIAFVQLSIGSAPFWSGSARSIACRQEHTVVRHVSPIAADRIRRISRRRGQWSSSSVDRSAGHPLRWPARPPNDIVGVGCRLYRRRARSDASGDQTWKSQLNFQIGSSACVSSLEDTGAGAFLELYRHRYRVIGVNVSMSPNVICVVSAEPHPDIDNDVVVGHSHPSGLDGKWLDRKSQLPHVESRELVAMSDRRLGVTYVLVPSPTLR